MSTALVIHYSDCNYQDKWYETTVDFAREFLAKWRELQDKQKTLDWFTSQVDYVGTEEGRPCKMINSVDTRLDQLFLGFYQFEFCFEEWAAYLEG